MIAERRASDQRAWQRHRLGSIARALGRAIAALARIVLAPLRRARLREQGLPVAIEVAAHLSARREVLPNSTPARPARSLCGQLALARVEQIEVDPESGERL